MGPHWGQGASQVMEDAYVMAEVLEQIDSSTDHLKQIEAAFAGWQEARKPQFEWLIRSSHDAFDWWSHFWRADLTEADMAFRKSDADLRLSRIWNANIGRQGEIAKCAMRRCLAKLAA